MSTDEPSRYAVPYSAPGVKRAELTVWAFSPTDALDKAREVHARRKAPTFGGPLNTLSKSERAQIVYGEARHV